MMNSRKRSASAANLIRMQIDWKGPSAMYFSIVSELSTALFRPCRKSTARVKKISIPNPIPIDFVKFCALKIRYKPV